MKMTYDEALRALESVAQNIPNRPSCWCCGYEHNCDRDGCALLESVKVVMEQLHKDVALGGCMTCKSKYVHADKEPCEACHAQYDKLSNWQWRGAQAPNLPSPEPFSDPS